MRACLTVQVFKGEPSGVQMVAYLRADRAGRTRRITPCSSGSHSARGISTTRGSLRNSRKYRRKADGVGSSGVPRLQRTIAVEGGASCWKSGSAAKVIGASLPGFSGKRVRQGVGLGVGQA